MAKRFTVVTVFTAKDGMTAPISRMQNRVGRFTRSMTRQFRRLNRSIKKVNASIKSMALSAAFGIAAVGGVVVSIIRKGTSFEQQLVNAAARFPVEIKKGTAAFRALSDAARESGRSTEFTATQAAYALTVLAKAGFTAEGAIKALPGTINFSTANTLSLNEATGFLADTMGAFGLRTKDAVQQQKNLVRVSDVLTISATSASVSVNEIYETMKQGGPVGRAAGQSIETVATLAATIGNAGIKGQRAGTGLKNIFLALSAPTSTSAQLLARLNVRTTDTIGGRKYIRNAIEVFKDFQVTMSKMTDADQMPIYEQLFGKIPLAAAINLTKAGTAMDELKARIDAATGATDRMATTMRDTMWGRFKQLEAAIEGVSIATFGQSQGPLADAVDMTVKWIRANEELMGSKLGKFLSDILNNFEQIVQAGRQIAGVITLYLGLVVALKLAEAAVLAYYIVQAAATVVVWLALVPLRMYRALMLALPAVLAAVRVAVVLLNLAFAASPIGLLVVAVTALIAVGGLLYLAWEPVAEFFTWMWEILSGVVTTVINASTEFAKFFGMMDDADDSEIKLTKQLNVKGPADRSKPDREAASQSEVRLWTDAGVHAELSSGAFMKGIKLDDTGGM